MDQNKINTFLTNNKKFYIIIGAFIVIILYALYQKLQLFAIASLFFFAFLVVPDLPKIMLDYFEKILKLLRENTESVGKDGIKTRAPTNDPVIEKQKISSNDDSQNIFKSGNDYFFSGRLKEAIGEYKKIIKDLSNDESNNTYIDSYLNLGAAYLKLWQLYGDEQYRLKSIEASKKCLELRPDGYKSRINLAIAYCVDINKESDALELLEGADKRGTLREPATWGQVKILKAGLIYALHTREKENKNKLFEAELVIYESIALFNSQAEKINYAFINQAQRLLLMIQKRIKYEESTSESNIK